MVRESNPSHSQCRSMSIPPLPNLHTTLRAGYTLGLQRFVLFTMNKHSIEVNQHGCIEVAEGVRKCARPSTPFGPDPDSGRCSSCPYPQVDWYTTCPCTHVEHDSFFRETVSRSIVSCTVSEEWIQAIFSAP